MVNPAYPRAIEELKGTRGLGRCCRCRPVRYLNNIVNKIIERSNDGFEPCRAIGSFHSAWRTIQGIETMNMIRKGQIRWLPKSDILGQAAFVSDLFAVAIAV
jgi:IS6 family transposase